MKAALLYGKDDLRLEELPIPESDDGGMLLKMKACGICGSDSRMYFNGPTSRYLQPVILGHECCAQVVQAGGVVEGFEVGDLVAIAPVIPCMRCSTCARGKDNICERAGVIGCTVHGGMADYISVPAQMLRVGGVVRLPPGVSPRAGALAEVVGCCLHALRQTGLHPGDRVLILGGGPIGMTFLQLARLMGAAWVGMTGRRVHRLQLAKELGADEIIDVAGEGLGSRFKAAMDLTILANASVPSLKEAIQATRQGGNVLLFSGYLPGSTYNLDLNEVHYRQLHFHSSIDCTISDFQNAVSLLPQLQMDRLVSAIFPLHQAREAFQATREPQSVKVMFEW